MTPVTPLHTAFVLLASTSREQAKSLLRLALTAEIEGLVRGRRVERWS
jgi:hypothetical protein